MLGMLRDETSARIGGCFRRALRMRAAAHQAADPQSLTRSRWWADCILLRWQDEADHRRGGRTGNLFSVRSPVFSRLSSHHFAPEEAVAVLCLWSSSWSGIGTGRFSCRIASAGQPRTPDSGFVASRWPFGKRGVSEDGSGAWSRSARQAMEQPSLSQGTTTDDTRESIRSALDRGCLPMLAPSICLCACTVFPLCSPPRSLSLPCPLHPPAFQRCMRSRRSW